MLTTLLCATLLQTSILSEDAFTVRSEFMSRYRRVKDGMSPKAVEAILGNPDDVVQYPAPFAYDFWCQDGSFTWTYGSNRHLGYPTLGVVTFRDRKVNVLDKPGEVPPKGLFREGELRNTLRQMANISRDGSKSLATLRMVNLLLPLGKERILAAVREYDRVEGHWSLDEDPEIPLYALRVLFDCPEDQHIQMRPITTETPTPKNLYKIYPRYPVVLLHNVPIVLGSWEWRGMNPDPGPPAPTVADHLDHYSWFGTLRATPLMPTGNPLTAVAEMASARDYPFNQIYHIKTANSERRWDPRGIKDRAESDILSMLRTAAPQMEWNPEEDSKVAYAREKRLIVAAAKLEVRWDTTHQRFVPAHGPVLAQRDDTEYPEYAWLPRCLAPIKGKLTYERSAEFMQYGRNYSIISKAPVTPAIARFFDMTTGKCIAEHYFPQEISESAIKRLRAGKRTPKVVASEGSYGFGSFVKFPKGHPLKIVVTCEGKQESIVIADISNTAPTRRP